MPTAAAYFSEIESPTAVITADKVLVDVGEVVTFSAEGSSGQINQFIWSMHDGTSPFTGDPGNPDNWTLQHAFATEGIYLVSLCAVGAAGAYDIATVEIRVLNSPPVAHIVAPAEAVEDELVTLSGQESFDTPNDLPTLRFLWSLGDGTSSQNMTIQHSWASAGEYPITLYVVDDQGAMSADTKFIKVLNLPPIAAFTSNGSILEEKILASEDQVILFDASASTDTPSDAAELQYYWDFGDGSVARGVIAVHAFGAAGTYLVRLLVSDDDHELSQASATVEVSNESPRLDIKEDEALLYEGDNHVFVADSWDTPSDFPVLNYSWSFGGSGWRTSGLWTDDFNGSIEATVQDDNGAIGTDSTHVTVLNLPPSAWVESASTIANITFRVVGNKWQRIVVRLGYDGLVLREDNLTAEPPQPPGIGPCGCIPPILIYRITNFTFDATHVWTMSMDYLSNVSCGNTQVFITFTFKNRFSMPLHYVFKNHDSRTWHWSFCPNYLFAFAPIELKLSLFDPGNDALSLQVKARLGRCTMPVLSAQFPAAFPSQHEQTIVILPVCYWLRLLLSAWCLEKMLRTLSQEGYGFVLEFTVRDDDGASTRGEIAFRFTSENGLLLTGTGPTVSLISVPSLAMEDELLSFEAALAYPSLYTGTPTSTWSFGDGTNSTGMTASHQYASAGTYLVRLTVQDATSTKVYSQLVKVMNRSPVARILLSQYQVGEDDIIAFDGSQSYDTPSDIDSLRYYWDFGDGLRAYGAEAVHAFARAGNYTVSLLVVDDDGAIGLATENVVVLNEPPRILGPLAFSGDEGQAVNIEVAVEDSIVDEPTLHLEWLLNGNALGCTRFSFWNNDGCYATELSVTDEKGNSTSSQVQITIDDVKPEVVLLPMVAYGIRQPITFYAFAVDAFTDFELLSFEWYINGQYPPGLSHSPWSTLTYEFEYTGHYVISVEVQDEAHSKAVASFNCTIVWDKNGNGTPDELEIIDSDGDGLSDAQELEIGTNPNCVDTDNDGLWDGIDPSTGVGELTAHTNPTNPDTDGDGLPDGAEVRGWTINVTPAEGKQTRFVTSNPLSSDTDGDGVPDAQEYAFKFDPTRVDTDGDGLNDAYENQTLGTSPVNYDTDYDGVPDGLELLPYFYVSVDWPWIRWTTSDPTKPDTDSDQLNDYEERYPGRDGYITDARLNDTDADMALDSAEAFSQEFSLGKRASVTSQSDFTLQINTQGQTTQFLLTIGFTDIEATRLSYTLFKDATPVLAETVDQPSIVLYKAYDLSKSVTRFGGTWTLRVSVQGKAILDQFSAPVTTALCPVWSDMDLDGLKDGEELSGKWITNPLMWDTDQDGWNDFYEVRVAGTNPLSADTDGDGVIDPRDINPLRNTLVKITVLAGHIGNPPIAPWFIQSYLLVTLTVDGVNTYITPAKACTRDWVSAFLCASVPSTTDFNYDYYFDIADDSRTITIRAALWLYGGIWPDTKLLAASTAYTVGSTEERWFSCPVWLDGEHWLWLRISPVYLPRVNTIAIHTADIFAEGHYRSLERYYTLVLDVTNAPLLWWLWLPPCFAPGINIITVPRLIFQNTLLNQMIQDGQVPACLQGATFCGMDEASKGISQSIEGTITGPVTWDNALAILDLLLRNSTGQGAYLYYATWWSPSPETMGLPTDVLRLIPFQGVANGPTGRAPRDLWGWLGGIFTGIVNAIAEGIKLICGALIALANFIGQLIVALVDWGMKALAVFTAALVQVIAAVVKLAVVALGYVTGAVVRALLIASIAIVAALTLAIGLQPSLSIEWNLLQLTLPLFWISVQFADMLFADFPWYRFQIQLWMGRGSVSTLALTIGLSLDIITQGICELSPVVLNALTTFIESQFATPTKAAKTIASIVTTIATWLIWTFVSELPQAAMAALFVTVGVQVAQMIAVIVIQGVEGFLVNVLSCLTSILMKFGSAGIGYLMFYFKFARNAAIAENVTKMNKAIKATWKIALEWNLVLVNVILFAIFLGAYLTATIGGWLT